MLSVSKFTYNKVFFDTPNVINSYWGGYLAADGCVKQLTKNSWQLRLLTIDRYLVDTFFEDVNYTGYPYLERLKGNKQQTYIGQIIGIQKDWLFPLTEIYKIIPNKTKDLKIPELKSRDHILSYIKGYIDGDGSIVFKQDKRWLGLHICSYTSNIMEWILENIKKEVNTKININKRKKRQLYQIDLGSSPAYNFLKILDKIPRGLPRKWDRIKEYERLRPEVLKI